jgi:hypothetical protein
MRESNSSDEADDDGDWREDSVDGEGDSDEDGENKKIETTKTDSRKRAASSSTVQQDHQKRKKEKKQKSSTVKGQDKGKGKAPARDPSPIPSSSASSDDANEPASDSQKRNPIGNLYDAVAGRLGIDGFLSDKNRNLKPLRPDEVLYSRAGAPMRYEEDDEYTQHRHLPEGALPDSDLLKTIHAYVSDYYGSGSGHLGDTRLDFDSMDETALIAFGILLEETAAEILGETGHLAFVEDVDEE